MIYKLKVPQELSSIKKTVLELIGIMREEEITVPPFTTLPRSDQTLRNNTLLLNYAQLTPKVMKDKILKERLQRLRDFYRTINTTKLKDPFILALNEDPSYFLVGNMREEDIPYFIALKSLNERDPLEKINLESVARHFSNHFYPPPPLPFHNKISVIYINTGTSLEAQLALLWGIVIQNSTVNLETKKYLAKITEFLYSTRRIIPPFDSVPPMIAITEGLLPNKIKNLKENCFSDELMLKAIQYESTIRVKDIFRKKFGGQQRKALISDFHKVYRVNLAELKNSENLLLNFRVKHFQNRERAMEKFRQINVMKQFKELISSCEYLAPHGPEPSPTTFDDTLIEVPVQHDSQGYKLPPHISLSCQPDNRSPVKLDLPPEAFSPQRDFMEDPGFRVERKRFQDQTPQKVKTPLRKTVPVNVSPRVLENFFDEPAGLVQPLIDEKVTKAKRTFKPIQSQQVVAQRGYEFNNKETGREPVEQSFITEPLITTATDEQRDREMINYANLLKKQRVNPSDISRTFRVDSPLPSDPNTLWAALNRPQIQFNFDENIQQNHSSRNLRRHERLSLI